MSTGKDDGHDGEERKKNDGVDEENVEQKKISMRVVLTSDPTQPFLVITVPEASPFSALLAYAAEEFGVPSSSLAATSASGIGISGHGATCGSVFLKHGGEIRLLPRDRVGAQRL